MNLNDEKIKAKAAAYARATTSARCSRMGQCQDCTVRYCNYRSRYEAYLQGYAQGESDTTDRFDGIITQSIVTANCTSL